MSSGSNPSEPTVQAAFDPGLTQKYTGTITRAITKDGQFNVRRRGGTWHDIHPYLFLINSSWPVFGLVVLAAYLVVNTIFATVYYLVGLEHLQGTAAPTAFLRFLNAFFFSAHTLTTVGYGNFYPIGVTANVVAATEALVGLMTFALATGLLFGRFSRPTARIGFSQKMVVAPYANGAALQFRIVNRRSNHLIDLTARVMLMTVEPRNGRLERRYKNLSLERDHILFFPLTWTIVHPIDSNSPLFGKTLEDLKQLQAEVLILINGIDETFGQQVYARSSYRYDEIEWGARFQPAFQIDSQGEMVLEVNRVGDIEASGLSNQSLPS